FPIVYIIYIILPDRIRRIWLLAASYFFYYCADAHYVPLLFAITLLAWLGGLATDRAQRFNKTICAKYLCILTVILDLGILCYFKYFGFFVNNLLHITTLFPADISNAIEAILPPLGISFILFQSISYTLDVYRQKISAERNFMDFALYLAFFPKLVSGPIERAGSILNQIRSPFHFRLSDMKEGLSLILMGLFLKLVISDNIAAVINPVFVSWQNYSGIQIALSLALSAFQIYGDFGGYSYIAIGSARMLGFQLSNNFEAPYHAESVSEFWTRWHITLNTWLRDYLYIPLGGNRKGTLRKYINTMLVFLLSGLWHGADWSFIVWGGLNGLYIIAEQVSQNISKNTLHQNHTIDRFSTHLRRRLVTFILFDFSLLFFLMPDLASSFEMIRYVVTHPGIREIFSLGFLNLFPDTMTFAVIFFSLLALLWIDTIIYRTKTSFTAFFFQQSSAFRWLVSIIVLCVIIFFGAYGENYEQTQFIYFQF
ncbi:MAG: MBOAT family protein, partial [Eubacterium sp.]|nr:MBOAT family protein [Eubacterium sp.]